MPPPSSPPAPDPPPVVDWDEAGAPRSLRYGDVYYSRDGGLDESRAVFLAGCGLPEAWAGRERFVVGELGFGTGLNIAALLDLWRRTRPPGTRLNIFTIESDPLGAGEAARALAAWPELAPIAGLLIARWPGRARGLHRIDLPELSATVDVAVLDAAQALREWTGTADAWFLDGFAPALNPDIWCEDVLTLVARRCAPGARLATYTVAGGVRRALASAGLSVERRPGHGRKRDRLEARAPGEATSPGATARVAIVGAGVAGAALARAFAAVGIEASVIDAVGPGGGASGAPAALAAPRLDAGLGPTAALFAQAARRAADLYGAIDGAVLARGVLQLPTGPKDPGRYRAIAGSDLFEPGTMRLTDCEETAALLGEPGPAGLFMTQALALDPASILRAWLGETRRAEVASIKAIDGGWRLSDAAGETILDAAIVCLAAGIDSADLAPALDLRAVRGQSAVSGVLRPPTPTMFGAYLMPARTGAMIGATHDRDDLGRDLRPQDRTRVLDALRQGLPQLADRIEAEPITDWAATRAATSDYLPLAGALGGARPGLFALTGLGSRGFCLAPLLAEHVAALAAGAPSPLPAPLADLVDPARFARRAARKGRPRASRI